MQNLDIEKIIQQAHQSGLIKNVKEEGKETEADSAHLNHADINIDMNAIIKE